MGEMNNSTLATARRNNLLCCLEAISESGVNPAVTRLLMNEKQDKIAYSRLYICKKSV